MDTCSQTRLASASYLEVVFLAADYFTIDTVIEGPS